jgi:hypothetical protein
MGKRTLHGVPGVGPSSATHQLVGQVGGGQQLGQPAQPASKPYKEKEGVSAGLTPPASPPPMRSLDWSYCDRPRTLGSLTDLELNPLVIVQRIAPTNLGMVDEHIFATVDSDKAKALIAVEPFDGSLCHIS